MSYEVAQRGQGTMIVPHRIAARPYQDLEIASPWPWNFGTFWKSFGWLWAVRTAASIYSPHPHYVASSLWQILKPIQALSTLR